MGSTATYWLGNRTLWSAGLAAGPIAGAVAGEILVGIIVFGCFVLPALIIFDTDRPWWSEEVRRLPQDVERTRVEMRKLNVWSGIALLMGLLIAFSRPWG